MVHNGEKVTNLTSSKKVCSDVICIENMENKLEKKKTDKAKLCYWEIQFPGDPTDRR